MTLRIGADIGGTFTDIVVEEGSDRWSVKVPTTHEAPEIAVIEGVERALAAAQRSFGEVALFVHGTTLATNALIERKGARTALLATDGFRDVLEMGTEGRFDQYDLKVTRPSPLIPRSRCFAIRERLRFDGSIVEPLNEADVRAVADRLRDDAIEAVAIAFLHSYANPAHELRARSLLEERLPGVPISTSHEVSPEMREFERFSTTSANAYLQPIVSEYLLRLQRELDERGLVAPLLMILSSGSLTTVETAARFPIRLLESGPAGGAIFAGHIARSLELDRVLSLDVGGTTAKFCLIDGGVARHARSFEVGRTYRFKKGSGLPVRVPVIDLVEIGAGGGSIARIDALGRITVGPDSAGSEPGPSCYARGGEDATVTDSDLVLGKVDPGEFAGGTMPLDRAAAERAIDNSIGRNAGLSVANAALAIGEVMAENMAAAARVHASEIGAPLEDRAIIAFGGGAPLHAARFAEKMGINQVIVPPGAGVGSAIGFLRAPVAYDLVRTLRSVHPGGSLENVLPVLGEMESASRAIVASVASGAATVERRAYMRYLGQGHEIEVAVGETELACERSLIAAFRAAYDRLYGRSLADAPVEVTAWAVRVALAEPEALQRLSAVSAEPVEAVADGTRRIYDAVGGQWEAWPVYHRHSLRPGATGPGPAIIAEDETTTIVLPAFRFRVDPGGVIILSRGRE